MQEDGGSLALVMQTVVVGVGKRWQIVFVVEVWRMRRVFGGMESMRPCWRLELGIVGEVD